MSDTNDVHRIVKYSSEAAVCAHNITVKAKVIDSLLDFFPANTRKTFIKNKCPFYTLSADMLTKIEHSVYHYNHWTLLNTNSATPFYCRSFFNC